MLHQMVVKKFICIKSCDSFLTEGKEYIGEPTSRGATTFWVRDNGGETWLVDDNFFLEKSLYIQRDRDKKIKKIIGNGFR